MEYDETNLTELELRQESELLRGGDKARPFLFSHQRAAFCELDRTASVFSKTAWWKLPFQPRFHRLIIGPTGAGKTYLAKALAGALDWPFLSISSSNWVLLGCSDRGGKQTWPLVAAWLAESNSFRLLFLDELDKIQGDDTWSRHLRTEIYNLLDRTIPHGLQIDADDDSGAVGSLERRTKAIFALRFRTLIIGGAAFQRVWEKRTAKRAGFHVPEELNEPPSQNDLADYLPRELINRFGPLISIQPLSSLDYEELLGSAARILPAELRGLFLSIGRNAIPAACRDSKGARFVEETLTATLAEKHFGSGVLPGQQWGS